MYELPLFPLNTVLFPGMPLRLHIFEDRYKLMIGRCQQSGEPFGVALIQQGEEVGSAAEPYRIGCTAYITQVETLTEGKLNLTAVGYERFQIHDLRFEQPYLTGMVEGYPLAQAAPELLNQRARTLRAWIERYLQILAHASETPFDQQQLPHDPLKLAYLAAFLLQIPLPQKQDLLAINRADDLLAELRTQYRREVTLLQTMLLRREQPINGPFSPN
ncbi:MAG TPA: LON peptidase substrate-binding domain-containing protein [Phototrophicaceae bacterium]|nr:LON peptidase substrate-binding domain-containing protein [Phototrophicaceae bacterium]